MSPHILRTLLGRIPHMIQPAYLPPNYVRYPVRGRVYPGVLQISTSISASDRKEDGNIDSATKTGVALSSSSPLSSSLSWEEIQRTCLEGILLTDITPSEMDILDDYEGGDYTKHKVNVSICGFHVNGDGDEDNNGNDKGDSKMMVKAVQDAQMYLWTGGEDRLDMDRSWSYEHFMTHHADTYFVD